jgi:hypothetical protein
LTPEGSSKDYGDKFQDQLLEQYKLWVEITDRTQQRRIQASSSDVLLVTNTLIAATSAAGVAGSTLGLHRFPSVVLGITGLLVCLAWGQKVTSYRAVLNAKYQVINEIETMLPLQLFAKEWRALADSKSYRPRMINFELLLPRLFALLHAVLIGVALT